MFTAKTDCLSATKGDGEFECMCSHSTDLVLDYFLAMLSELHIRIVPSTEPDMYLLPDGLNDTQLTGP